MRGFKNIFLPFFSLLCNFPHCCLPFTSKQFFDAGCTLIKIRIAVAKQKSADIVDYKRRKSDGDFPLTCISHSSSFRNLYQKILCDMQGCITSTILKFSEYCWYLQYYMWKFNYELFNFLTSSINSTVKMLMILIWRFLCRTREKLYKKLYKVCRFLLINRQVF